MKKLIKKVDDHVKFSSIGPIGEIYYVADEYAAEYFTEKYSIEIEAGEEFDFTVLEENDTDLYQGGGFSIN